MPWVYVPPMLPVLSEKGDVDQLVDRSLCMREVRGSKPRISMGPFYGIARSTETVSYARYLSHAVLRSVRATREADSEAEDCAGKWDAWQSPHFVPEWGGATWQGRNGRNGRL